MYNVPSVIFEEVSLTKNHTITLKLAQNIWELEKTDVFFLFSAFPLGNKFAP